MIAKIEFSELDNVLGHSMQGIHFPNQIFCPIGKKSKFGEMGAQKLALGEKIVATFDKSVPRYIPQTYSISTI